MRLRREVSGWTFGGSEQAKIDETVIADLIAKGMVVATDDKAEISAAGKAALYAELDAILARTSTWLKTLKTREDRRGHRKR
jgi:uncharacterized membrane protein YhfC